MYHVIKRDGNLVDFDLGKIRSAIEKAFEAEKINFHPNSKELQRQRILKLLHNCTHLTCQQSNA